MKKAKIVLTSIAVLAIVGGTFAYKAAKNPIAIYTCSNQATPSSGTCVLFHVAATSSTPGFPYSLVLGTTDNVGTVSCTSGTPCTSTLYTVTVDAD